MTSGFCITITGSITLATGGLLILEGIIGPVVSVSITGSITLATGGLLVPEGIIGPVVSVSDGLLVPGYHPSSSQCFYYRVDNSSYWLTISPRGYHRSSSQCFYHRIDSSYSYWWTQVTVSSVH
ncbi:MAG: hypothetical protein H0A75_06765 [Candidatus Methanofishera endochildressiae]|uniref:Uncharacterized protein n=1 Tax=Candidatus Methanofishera endochildressiae TaxID=2738884 RepID=A0A7Z0MP60_9GAMM|nr:hypothetical protein [Candidatus Methanofishera endochildressiae]